MKGTSLFCLTLTIGSRSHRHHPLGDSCPTKGILRNLKDSYQSDQSKQLSFHYLLFHEMCLNLFLKVRDQISTSIFYKILFQNKVQFFFFSFKFKCFPIRFFFESFGEFEFYSKESTKRSPVSQISCTGTKILFEMRDSVITSLSNISP